MPMVVLPHPLAGVPLNSALAKLDAVFDEIVEKLTASPNTKENADEVSQSEWVDIDVSDEWGELQREFISRGWSDGMLAAPPTESRVAEMVRASGYKADKSIGVVLPRQGVATVERIAANAVMAGCQPEHMPILIAAVGAMVDPIFSLRNIQATTHCVAPLLIVNGPLTKALNIHSGSGLFGPGPWANGVLGRALRLILLNIGGAIPGEVDKATMGHPGKFSFCIAENEAANPWSPLHVERGFASEMSTVTMYAGEAPHNINDHESTSAEGLLAMISGAMSQIGQNSMYYTCEMLLVLSPEHAATIAAEGYSKDDVKQAIYEQAYVPMSRFSKENIERRLWRFHAQRYLNCSLDTKVGILQKPEDVIVVVAGGEGKHSMYLPTTGSSRAITRPIVKADGSPWVPADFDAIIAGRK